MRSETPIVEAVSAVVAGLAAALCLFIKPLAFNGNQLLRELRQEIWRFAPALSREGNFSIRGGEGTLPEALEAGRI